MVFKFYLKSSQRTVICQQSITCGLNRHDFQTICTGQMLPCILCTCTIDVLVSKFSCDLLLRDSVISNGTFFHIQDNDQNLDLYLPIPAYWPLLSRGNRANAVPNPEIEEENIAICLKVQ